MRVCPNCRKNVAEREYCENCGYKFPEGGGKRKRRGILAGLAWGGATLAALVLMCFVLLRPRAGFEEIQRRALIDPALELAKAALEFAESPELSADLTLTADCDDFLLSRVLAGSGAALKLEIGDGDALVNGAVTVMGSTALTGYVTLRDGRLGFALPQADGKYYSGAALTLPEVDAEDLSGRLERCADILFEAVNERNLAVYEKEELRLEALGRSFTGTRYVFEPSPAETEAAVAAIEEELGVSLPVPDGFVWSLCAEGTKLRSLAFSAEGAEVVLEAYGTLKKGMEAAWTLGYNGFTTTVKGTLRLEGRRLSGAYAGDGFGGTFALGGGEPLDVTLALEGDPLGVGIDGLSFALVSSAPSTAREPEGEPEDISGYTLWEVLELAGGLLEDLAEDISYEMGGMF